MYQSILGADHVRRWVVAGEVDAEAAALPEDDALLVAVYRVGAQLLVRQPLERHQQLLLQPLLHGPLQDIAIAADRNEKLRRLLVGPLVHPPRLPDDVGVLLVVLLARGGTRAEHRLVGLPAQVPNHHRAVVRARGDHVGVHRGEVEGRDAMPRPEHSLRVSRVLQGPEKDQTALCRWHRGRVTVGDGQQVLIMPVPLRASDGRALRQLRCVEAEEVLQGGLVRLLLALGLGLVDLLALARLDAIRHSAHTHALALQGAAAVEGCVCNAGLLRPQLVEPRQLLQSGVVPVDHVLLVEDVLRDDSLHHLDGLREVLWDRRLASRLPWHDLWQCLLANLLLCLVIDGDGPILAHMSRAIRGAILDGGSALGIRGRGRCAGPAHCR
mmetsp:Transcript_11157/g.39511  ORF Transcript_11157/g.39511 Transcript_11157/m.39511 type:complete len:383 (-) Transcript_11157:1044-2192(-)